MRCNAIVRPGFHPLSIGLMVIGFLIAWPLGLAMLAYMLWGDRFDVWPRFKAFMQGLGQGLKEGSCGCGPASVLHTVPGYGTSGNSAFDAYRAAELERLEAERRRLDEERREFETYMAQLRRARDQEEFDRFKADRAAGRSNGPRG